ncbi:unnamed protein product [Blepharisma stoltei]|uniref:Protein of centriole 5 n=1 Tax=Blepharisma stoltei TaxID=1481888 RepID=A0AAU9IH02_9CILI|nr:unnamed protein product [Blepharisma stoltei]
MEVSEYSLNSLVNKRFEEFLQESHDEMHQFFEAHRAANVEVFTNEKKVLQEKIESQINEINQLKATINHYKAEKSKSKFHAYLVCKNVNGKRVKKKVMDSWKDFLVDSLKKKKMNEYLATFYKRGLLKRSCRGWKNELQVNQRKNIDQATERKIREAVEKAVKERNQELEILRKMVTEISDDLKNENLAKNHLQYQCDQALLRSMSALHLENMTIRQVSIENNKALTQTSRNLLFTPDKAAVFR